MSSNFKTFSKILYSSLIDCEDGEQRFVSRHFSDVNGSTCVALVSVVGHRLIAIALRVFLARIILKFVIFQNL